MKVVFLEDVEGTAIVGEVREVANGYARNFLLPRGVAVVPTEPNLQRARSLAEKEARHQEQLDIEASVFIDRLSNYVVTFEVRVGETGQLFGSVTTQMISDMLNKSGYDIDKKDIIIEDSIKAVGNHYSTISLGQDISARIKIKVKAEK